MDKILLFLFYEAIILGVVFVAGLATFGDVRTAARYFADWLRVIGYMVAAAAVIFALVTLLNP